MGGPSIKPSQSAEYNFAVAMIPNARDGGKVVTIFEEQKIADAVPRTKAALKAAINKMEALSKQYQALADKLGRYTPPQGLAPRQSGMLCLMRSTSLRDMETSEAMSKAASSAARIADLLQHRLRDG